MMNGALKITPKKAFSIFVFWKACWQSEAICLVVPPVMLCEVRGCVEIAPKKCFV